MVQHSSSDLQTGVSEKERRRCIIKRDVERERVLQQRKHLLVVVVREDVVYKPVRSRDFPVPGPSMHRNGGRTFCRERHVSRQQSSWGELSRRCLAWMASENPTATSLAMQVAPRTAVKRKLLVAVVRVLAPPLARVRGSIRISHHHH